tara:strand:- start:186 stop:386 length:201 start_codon:yes stop_codon:yes gene_type:complete
MRVADYVFSIGAIFIASFLFVISINIKNQQIKLKELEERLFYLESVMSADYYGDKLDEQYQFYYGE